MLYFNKLDYKENKKSISIKDIKGIYPACKIYRGLCSCKESYIGESKCNIITRWGDRNNPTDDCESANICTKTSNIVTIEQYWQMLLSIQERENQEAKYIALLRPNLNDQLE